MKKGVLIAVIFVLAVAFSVFGQDSPQAPPEEKVLPRATETAVPDLSKLYPLEARKRFLVVRDGRDRWVRAKEDGDIQVFVEQSFSESGESDEVVARALYPLDEVMPCAVSWKKIAVAEAFTFAVMREDGKWVTTENARIRLVSVTDEEYSVASVKVYLYSGNDANRTRLAEREFVMTRKMKV